MKSFPPLIKLGGAFALLSFLALPATAQVVSPSFHLAYAVDTTETIGANPNSNYNKLLVRDHHDDHYHGFTQNNGTPGGHVPVPLTIDVADGFGAISLAAWNDSPDAGGTRYFFPAETDFDLHLELVSVSSTALRVSLQHDDHYHTLTAGGEGGHLHFGEFQNLRFSFSEDAAPAAYTAEFRIVDEAGFYANSNPFTIHVTAVPEPSAYAAIGGALTLGLAVCRRRRRDHDRVQSGQATAG